MSTNSFGLQAAIAAQRAGELTSDSLSPSPIAAVAATPPAPDYCISGPRYIDFSVLMLSASSSSSSSSSTCSTTSNNSSLSGSGGASLSVHAPAPEPDLRIYGKRLAAMVRPRLLLSDFVDVTDTLPAPDAAPDYTVAHSTAIDGDWSDEDEDEDEDENEDEDEDEDEDDEEQVIEPEPEPDSPDGDATAAERLACSLPLAAFHFVGGAIRVGKSVLRSASATSASASTPEVTDSERKVCICVHTGTVNVHSTVFYFLFLRDELLLVRTNQERFLIQF